MTCIYCNKETTGAYTQENLYGYEADTFCNKKCADKYLQTKVDMLKFGIKNSATMNLRSEIADMERTMQKIEAIKKARRSRKQEIAVLEY